MNSADQKRTAPFAALLDEVARGFGAAEAEWLVTLRRRGRESFAEAGMPTAKVEAWKYTSLNRLSAIDFALADDKAAQSVKSRPSLPHVLDGPVAVFVNGAYRPDLSRLTDLPAGVSATNLVDLTDRDPARLEPHLGRIADLEDKPLTALNTALLGDGLVLLIEDGVSFDRPVHLVSLGVTDGTPLIIHPRHLVVLGKGATATLVESHLGSVGPQGAPYLSNGVLEVAIGEAAGLTHIKFQDESAEAFHIATTEIALDRASRYDGAVIQLGAAMARNEVHARMASPQGDFRLNGIYVGSGERHLDNTSVVTHAAPECRSRQLFRGVITGRARGVFQGKVAVEPQAQRTDAHQESRALLLSPDAEMDGKPELEIYADDVKCSHGATVGALDEEALFYLRSRGIDEVSARHLLIEAFLSEVIDAIPLDALRDAVHHAVVRRLEQTREE